MVYETQLAYRSELINNKKTQKIFILKNIVQNYCHIIR